jgi:SAM-dependent methyltransferase
VPAPHEHQPLLRFSNRVGDYVRHRPGYPPELIAWLCDVIDLRPAWIVADVGSGTGLLARGFCRHGNLVYGVEPNAAMRAAAEEAFAHEPHFVSIDGSAEATTLPDGSVDLVAAGQAFHWFDPEPARREWRRILSPGGRALIVFNSRRVETTPFMRAYDAFLMTHAVDYQGVDHRRVLGDGLRAFLDDMHEWRFEVSRTMTFEDVRGLSMSSSYVPAPEHPKHAAFMHGLEKLVGEHAHDGTVEMLYQTEAYVGRL